MPQKAKEAGPEKMADQNMLSIPVQRLNNYQGSLPRYATAGSAGMDIQCALNEPYILEPGSVGLLPTGLAIALPPGYECQIRSRSGLAAKHGIFALNAPGTVDSDYRGEIRVILANFGKTPYTVQPGERIAQLVIARYESVQWQEMTELPNTDRGQGGFGSTGKL
jgi:dUTP pyrophosphatase